MAGFVLSIPEPRAIPNLTSYSRHRQHQQMSVAARNLLATPQPNQRTAAALYKATKPRSTSTTKSDR